MMRFYPYSPTEKPLNPAPRGETRGNTPERAGTKPPFLSNAEISTIMDFLNTRPNKAHALITQLTLCTGARFSELKALPWGAYNSRLSSLRIKNRTVFLHAELKAELDNLRENAKSEWAFIVPVNYKNYHRVLRTAFDRAGIISPKTFLSLRLSFCARHFQVYQSRKMLKAQLGLTTLRYLPREIFSAPRAGALNLFQGVA